MLTISNDDCLKRVRLTNDKILNQIPSNQPNTLFSIIMFTFQSSSFIREVNMNTWLFLKGTKGPMIASINFSSMVWSYVSRLARVEGRGLQYKNNGMIVIPLRGTGTTCLILHCYESKG